jgi:predicted TIM-barrel fold metal-dependent hydrolase
LGRITVVSGDGHVGCSFEKYRPYIEPAYRDRLDDLAREQDVVKNGYQGFRDSHMAGDVLPAVDERGMLSSRRYLDLYEDVQLRLAQMDEEGIAGDFLLAGSEYALPFFHEINDVYPADVRAAGMRAYHRWLADFVGESGGRLFANAYSLPSADIDPMLEELRFVAERGFKSVEAPTFVHDPSLPPLTSKFYEPFWAACAEYGIVLNVHAGWGQPQGPVIEFLDTFAQMGKKLAAEGVTDPADLMKMMGMGDPDEFQAEVDAGMLEWAPRQALWQFMLSGIFDRHPSLKLVLVELRADWLPATLACLDRAFARRGSHLPLKPSEYFARNCAVTPSSPRPTEVNMRHDIGIDQYMFGADMPHAEGTWPNTRRWLAHTFVGVPKDELRKILGENAIRFYNLDRRPLDEAAARIGPTVEEITAGLDLDERVLKHFNRRSGYLKPVAETDVQHIEALLNEDFTHAEEASL